MDVSRFEQITLEVTAHATVEQRIELVQILQKQLRDEVVSTLTAIRARSILSQRSCPHCGHNVIHRHGRGASGRARFRCVGAQGCGRTFGVFYGTAFHRMKKADCWLPYVERLLQGLPLTHIVGDRIGISRHTAWRWRHRLLPGLKPSPQPRLSGIIEVDETYFPTSYKGSRGWKRGNPPEERPPRYRGSGALRRGLSLEQVPILTAVDRNKTHLDQVLPNRKTKTILDALLTHMEPHSAICSDAYPAYRKLAEITGSAHHVFVFERPTPEEKVVGLPRGVEGSLGLGRVNSWHERMDTRFNRIHRGVSTAYLPSYLTMLNNISAENIKPQVAMKRLMEKDPPKPSPGRPTDKLN